MKIGLIARADNRGLGIQTRGFYDNLQPSRTLVIDPGPLSPLAQDFSRYPDGIITSWSGGQLDESTLRRFLTGLDVVYTAETPYDFRLFDLARSLGVRTILHVNAEFYRYHIDVTLPRPDVFWLHSSWLSDQIPHDAVMPVPVDRRRFPFRHRTSVSSFVHIIGMKASRDRNGTASLFHALNRVGARVKVNVFSQAPSPRLTTPRTQMIGIEVHTLDTPDALDIYDSGDVFVLPRRYGGGCLPMFEAMSCGLPVLMTDAPPQDKILPPSCLIRSVRAGRIRTQFGPIMAYDAHSSDLARRMTALQTQPQLVSDLSCEMDELASAYSWDTWRPRYLAELERAVES